MNEIERVFDVRKNGSIQYRTQSYVFCIWAHKYDTKQHNGIEMFVVVFFFMSFSFAIHKTKTMSSQYELYCSCLFAHSIYIYFFFFHHNFKTRTFPSILHCCRTKCTTTHNIQSLKFKLYL